MSYHAQDNYKLQRTGNLPTLTRVLLLLLLLLLEVGIYYEWNWANENAKHYNLTYCKHKNFQTVMNGLFMIFLRSVAYFKNDFVTFIITLSPGVTCDIH